MNQRNQMFIHFDICIDRLNGAWRTLKTIKEHPGHPLVGSAFRFALVEYAVSYTRSDGPNKERYRLDTRYVPVDFLPRHEHLLASRNQIQAHADLIIFDAKLSYIDHDGQRLVSIGLNNINGFEELPHIDEIILLIEGTLENMYADRDNLKLTLEP
ncbi:MAG: hypothetical protein ABI171_06610 [Collimonas sp.]|uniref:hypothetical protein n=1 Tax=Collimonas sp. TaxID=1963772 RepID=UPI0032677FE0